MEYEPSSNSIIALKPFFETFAKNSVTGESWQQYPLKLMELLTIEASHSVGLGLTAQTTLTQSYSFARKIFNVSLNYINKLSTAKCGKFGDLQTRASDCAWFDRSFVHWPPRRYVTIAASKIFLSHQSGNDSFYRQRDTTSKSVVYDMQRKIAYASATFGGNEWGGRWTNPPDRTKILTACEELRTNINFGAKSRLATKEEIFDSFFKIPKDGVYLFI